MGMRTSTTLLPPNWLPVVDMFQYRSIDWLIDNGKDAKKTKKRRESKRNKENPTITWREKTSLVSKEGKICASEVKNFPFDDVISSVYVCVSSSTEVDDTVRKTMAHRERSRLTRKTRLRCVIGYSDLFIRAVPCRAVPCFIRYKQCKRACCKPWWLILCFVERKLILLHFFNATPWNQSRKCARKTLFRSRIFLQKKLEKFSSKKLKKFFSEKLEKFSSKKLEKFSSEKNWKIFLPKKIGKIFFRKKLENFFVHFLLLLFGKFFVDVFIKKW